MAVIGQRGILSRACDTQTEFNSVGMAQAYIFAGLLLKRLIDRIRPHSTIYAFRFEQRVGQPQRSAKTISARRVFIKIIIARTPLYYCPFVCTARISLERLPTPSLWKERSMCVRTVV